MGTVWEAHDQVLDRRVAVKEVDTARGDATARERVLREARIAARLKHGRLVDIYDIVEEGDRVYLVQEFVDAPTLADVVTREGPLSPARAAIVGAALLDGLEAMHAAGIVHRDLKPSNVLLDGDRPKLTDYGIALVADDPRLTSTGLVLGSPAYLSPEQALGEPIGPATDLWSLGATLFFAVEGRAPYEGQGGMATAMQVVNQEPPVPTAAGALAPVISGLMRRDPTTRVRDAELRGLLDTAAAAGGGGAPTARIAEPTVALPPTYERRVERAAPVPGPPPRRSPLPWIAAALVAIALLGAAALALAGADDPAPRASATTIAPAAGDVGGDGSSRDVTTTTAVRRTTTTVPADGEEPPPSVPGDWVRYEVARPGYSVAVPPDWQRRPLGDTRTDFVDPDSGTYLRVDWTDEPGDSPEQAWRDQSRTFAAQRENYREIRIEPTTYRGFDAALWEYTYSEGGAQLHAYNLGFVTGGYGFALNFQSPESRWAADSPMFEQLKAGFEPPSEDDEGEDD